MADLILSNLKAAGVGFKKNYQIGFDSVTPLWKEIASEVPSSTTSNDYGWLGDIPGMREWLGERVINRVSTHDYSIKNRKWENTLGFLLDDLSDDNLGIYAPRMQMMGETVARHPDELVFETLQKGFTSLCYDGQTFFDTDHLVIDKDKKETSVSNVYVSGQQHPNWYLLDTGRRLKPLVRQVRQKPDFKALADVTSEHVFMLDEVLYGVKTRENVGFGFWQMAAASQQEFNMENFATAYTNMSSQEGDFGKKLALNPSTLLVPPTLEDEANMLMNNEKLEGGARNPHKGKCKVVVCPWLSN